MSGGAGEIRGTVAWRVHTDEQEGLLAWFPMRPRPQPSTAKNRVSHGRAGNKRHRFEIQRDQPSTKYQRGTGRIHGRAVSRDQL